jgi:CHAT domain-containing protein
MPLRGRRPVLLAVLILLSGTAAGVALEWTRAEPDLLRALARESRGHGLAGARLGGVSGFLACEAGTPRCEVPRPGRRVRTLIESAGEAARNGTDPRALRAAALANLIYFPGALNLVDQSISYLQSAARMAEHPAPVLADLAGAHLVRADQAKSAHDLFKALDAARRALEQEPANREARFNAAEAQDRIGLRRQAAEAWELYLAADSTTDWAAHAQRRLRALSRLPRALQPPPRTSGAAAMAAYAVAEPRAARELGWDGLLPEWGAAILDGDTATARARLDQAAAIGDALAARAGDASLQDAVREIRRRRADGPATRRLARLHRLLGEARALQMASRLEPACGIYRQVQAGARAGALREWADTFVGLCSAYLGEGDLRALASLAAAADSTRHSAIAARRFWVLGFARQKAGRWDDAIAAYERMGRMASGAGEADISAQATMLVGNAYAELGDAEAGYAALHQAFAVLRDFPGSLGMYSALYALRNASLADGLSHAVMPIQDEAVAVAREMSQPLFLAETLLARARLHLAAGRGNIDRDLRGAMRIMDGLPDGYVLGSLAADLHEARSYVRLAADPAGAVAELDSALQAFSDETRRVPALLARAEALLAQGRGDLAEHDLRSAADLLDSQGGSVGSAQLRASLLEQSRRVFDRAVMLNVNAGRNAEALAYVERSRVSFSPAGQAPERARRPLRAPRGAVAVEYALVGDTLLAWTLWDGGMQLTRATVARDELVRTVEEVRSALELRSAEGAVRPGLERLYDWLIRPLRARFGAAGTPLVIVADGELASIPMAALRDRQRGRYLVQDHPVRFAGSLRDPATPTSTLAAGTRVTLVQDPAFDLEAYPQLERLAGAAEEVRRVRRDYAGARVLREAEATAGALRDAFQEGGVVHFAGHAVFDDARPERSYLLAAPDGPDPTARLTAAEVERMDLRGLRLVVLSACQTSRSAAGRSGGFAGLAGAFLAAGAGGVVGSVWRVDDGYTWVLMEGFHRRYRATGDPARALREAQLAMLASRDPALRSPAAWAGFRYAGG